MKLARLILLTAIVVISGVLPTVASAADHEKFLGIRGGYVSYNNSAYIALNFTYSFADHFRIAPEVGYAFSHNGNSAIMMSGDMEFPFRVYRGIAVYPLAGVTYNNWSREGRSRLSRIGGNVGVGTDFYMTEYLKLDLQVKYSIMKNCSGVFAGIGIGYIF
ncbi:MAG: hypothetical protein K2M87_08030 [Muribaculaceae bacterium]|nr:hypothetical protein [Muribaculaceae bacterium]